MLVILDLSVGRRSHGCPWPPVARVPSIWQISEPSAIHTDPKPIPSRIGNPPTVFRDELLDLTPENQRVLLHRARAKVRAALERLDEEVRGL